MPVLQRELPALLQKLKEIRRIGVYELLYGKNLTAAIREAKGEEQSELDYMKLKDVIKKGIALGYLYPDIYDRWVFEYE